MDKEITNQTNDQDAPQKVTFTPQQQARVDEIVRESMGRAGREARQEAAALAEEVKNLRAGLAAAKAKPELEDSQQQALENIHAENKSLRAIASDLHRNDAIQRAAAGVGFVNLDAVRTLTSKNVRYDEQRARFVVIDDDGHERLNSSHEPMSLEDFYVEYAGKNPYLVRSEVKGGSGSSQNAKGGSASTIPLEMLFGPKSNAELANKVARRDPLRYRALREKARQAGLI